MICHTTNNPAPSISTARWEEGGEEGGARVAAFLTVTAAVYVALD